MELRTLRYLLAVERAGSVTRASSQVLITQPTMSRQLRQLERDLGLTLFTRHRDGLRLSAAGREFLPVAQRVVAQADEALAAAATIAAGRMQRIAIAAPGTTLTDVVAPFLATLDSHDPLPTVRQEVPGSVYDTLGRGTDLAIGAAPPPAHLEQLALANLPVWAYVPPGHARDGSPAVALEDLVTEHLLVPRPELPSRRAFDRALAWAGLSFGEVDEFDAPEVAQAVAASGKGVAVVSDDPRFGLHPLPIEGPGGAVRIRLWAAWRPEHHGGATLADLAMRLRDFCVARYGSRPGPMSDRHITAASPMMQT